ncbi:MAG: RIFT barrel domain-containing protein [Armatimonadota bacterium]
MSTDATCAIHVAYGDPCAAGLPVSLGVPFTRGALKQGTPLAVQSPSGELRPADGRPLALWPHGSVRWCLVSFGAREAGRHEVVLDPAGTVEAPTVTVRQEGDRWMVQSDRLRIILNETGPGIFSDIICDGHAYLARPEDLSFCVDEASTLHETRRAVRVIEQSPLRVRLRVEGGHFRVTGERCLAYRLDVEVWAGWPALRLDYQYFHIEPGEPTLAITRIACDTAWQLGPDAQRHFLQRNHGLFYEPRHVFNPAPVAIAADFPRGEAHVEDPAMLLDDVDYPFYLKPPLVGTQDWLGVGDGEHAVYLQMQDFLAARPNRMTSAEHRLALEMWPATAEALELPQGRSRRQTFTLAFLAQDDTLTQNTNPKHAAPKGLAAALRAPVHEGRACVDPGWLAAVGDFEQDRVLPAGAHIRIENNLAALMVLDMPTTKFDVGDTDSEYNRGRSDVPLAGAPSIPPVFPRQTPTQTYLDCHEPVWTNNEYDIIHAFSSEIMRTGRHELWNTLRLAARHNIEVDFLHYSDHQWLHRATPAHSVRHTTTGAYPSHFWSQGLLEYYCLSGDIDALEVACALGEKTIENFTHPGTRRKLWGFNREIGWSVLTLACLYDVTREARFKALLDELVDFLVAYDRNAFCGAINLSRGNDRQNLNRQIVGNFFGYASMIEGVDLYARTTGREDVAEWLQGLCRDLADEGINAAREGDMPPLHFSTALNVGYERTGEMRFVRMMSMLLDQVYWNARGVQGENSVKPIAKAYRGLTRMLGHAWRHGLLDTYEYPSMREMERVTE